MESGTTLTRPTSLTTIKEYGKSPEILDRFAEIVGRHEAGRYIQSAILAVASSDALQQCSPQSIFAAALRAATVQLLCEPSLGQAHLVPFKGKAALIIGYKGLYQLALRTGKYRYINVSPIFEGEEFNEDRITGLITMSGSKRSNTITGYIASFQLTNGYSKSLVMSLDEIQEHTQKYAKGFDRPDSPWRTSRAEMQKKTVLRLLLTRYGYLDSRGMSLTSRNAEDEPEVFEPDIPDSSLPAPEEVTIIDQPPRTASEIRSLLGFQDDYDAPQHQPLPDPDPEPILDPPDLGIASEIRNHNGIPYQDLDTSTLSSMANAIYRGLRIGKYPTYEISDQQKKLDVIRQILKVRNDRS